MPQIKLYTHQKTGTRKSWDLLKVGKNVLLVSPTASGKTFMMAEITRRALRENKSVLVLAHRWELLDQARSEFIRYGINERKIGVLGKGTQHLPDYMSVCIASVQTYRNRDIEQADFVLVDEAHHTPAPTYREVLSGHRHGEVIGFTATPVRLDHVGFVNIFDEMVIAATTKSLLKKGLITAPTCWGPGGLIPELDGVPVRAGDFEPNALAEVMDKPELTGNVLQHYRKHAKGQQAIGFAVSVQHAEHLAKRFRDAGVTAAVIDGSMPMTKRNVLLADFRAGVIRVLWTCQLANEGLNIPAVRVIIMARPTMSFVVYRQQAGRGMRPGVPSILLDHAGNVIRHGFPHADREFSLTGELDEVPEAAQAKECPECGNFVMCGEMTCAACGYEFPVLVRKMILDESDDELVRLTYRAQLKRLRAIAKKKGWGEEWVIGTMAWWKKQVQSGE